VPRRVRPPESGPPDVMDDRARATARRTFLMATNRPDLIAVAERLRAARSEAEWWALVDEAGERAHAEGHFKLMRKVREDTRRRVEHTERRWGA
jgi:hypothetical protein